jgi:hypothetical protein
MIFALALIFIVFAMLLNSVEGDAAVDGDIRRRRGSRGCARTLQDLTVAFVSFLVASFLPLLGYRRAMMLALVIVGAACIAMPLYPSFITTRHGPDRMR